MRGSHTHAANLDMHLRILRNSPAQEEFRKRVSLKISWYRQCVYMKLTITVEPGKQLP